MAYPQLPDVDRLVEFFRSTPVLSGLTDAELAEIVYVVELVPVAAGQAVVREGEPGDAWYLLMEGRAQVEAHGVPLKSLLPTDCFGELAVLDGEVRTATVVAETPALVVRVSGRGFEALLSAGSLAAHKVVLSLTRLLARRMRTMLREAPGHALEYGGGQR